jgi:hypothetical protein
LMKTGIIQLTFSMAVFRTFPQLMTT